MSETNSRPLTHCVYFTLKDNSIAGREAFLAACHKYLTDHPGTVQFCVGPRAEWYQRPVNDAHFDVALVIVFATVADHDTYQQSPRHKQFISEQSAHWSQVRVFDALA